MYLNEERARGLMKDHNIDVLVASTPENVTYIAGTWGWSNKVYVYSVHMFAVYPRDAGNLSVPGCLSLAFALFFQGQPPQDEGARQFGRPFLLPHSGLIERLPVFRRQVDLNSCLDGLSHLRGPSRPFPLSASRTHRPIIDNLKHESIFYLHFMIIESIFI